jgi:threonine dehydrogenase-like Zn-dependent dehydrogenase
MRAERFYADSKTIAVENIPIPEPGPGEVLVKVAFCGICHSDLSLINGTFPPQRPVVTQGHEASGTIAKLGLDVTGWAVGDRVIVAAGRPCTACPNCRRGDIANCLRIQLMAFAYDGAWAEYTVAQAVGLTRVPDNVPLEQAAILADAVSTPFGAVVRTGKVGIGESVGVWGVGGIGTHIVQLARLVGAVPVIAVDIKPAVLERAVELGADHAFDARDERLGDKIAEITGGRMLDVAFDAVGLKSTFEQALDSVTVGGRLVVVGMSDQSPTVGPTSFFGLTQKQVRGHLGYQNVDIETLATLVSSGRLDISRSITDIVSLEDVRVGIEMLENQEGNPIRILIKP